MKYTALFMVLVSVIAVSFADHCSNPTFSDIQTYTTKDAKINTETTYVVEFRLKCSNYAKNVELFSEVNGNFLTSSTNDAGERYQISWTEPHKTARTGELAVKIYDEEGFSNLKRAQRNNEDLSKVKELKRITFSHPGSYKGPVVQSEYLVTLLFVAIFYWAFSTRSRIQA